MKTFLGINLPSNINQEVLNLIEDNKHLAPRATWQKCPHVTLAFIGEKSVDHEAIQTVANLFLPFQCSTSGFGTFKQGVAWLAIDQGFSKVHNLMKELHECLGLRAFGSEGYSPHLTLYKQGPTVPVDLKRKLVITAYGPWTVSSLTLFESLGGGNYQPIKEYPLYVNSTI